MAGNLVVLAGGAASRMKKAGTTALEERLAQDAATKVKAMIGVGDGYRPFLEYLLYHAWLAGYEDVVIVVGEQDLSVREFFGNKDSGNKFHGLTISYAVQRIPPGRTKPLGTADALLCALRTRPEWREGRFTVCNSDNLYSVNAFRLLRELPDGNGLIDYDRGALGLESARIDRFAVLLKDERGRLSDIVEMPDPETLRRARGPDGRIGVSMNIYAFGYERVLPYLERIPVHPVRQEKELPGAVRMMLVDQPGSVAAIPLAESVPDLTNQDDIERIKRTVKGVHLSWK
jgi:NDP-sugar pyrophosphorylase family protein